MDPRISFVTLGVGDVERSARFYEHVLKLRRRDSPPGAAFFEMGKTWLALRWRPELARDANVPEYGHGFRGFTLSHNVRSEIEVEILLDSVRNGGGRVVLPPRRQELGGYAGYFEDPDGFLWEVAWNPAFPHVANTEETIE